LNLLLHLSTDVLFTDVPSPVSSTGQVASLDVINAEIAARAEAAVVAGTAAEFLVSFAVSEQEITAQAAAISTASVDITPEQATSKARLDVYNAVKSQVLGALARPTSTSITDEAGTVQAVGPTASSVQVIKDYGHLPVAFVRITSASDLAQLRAHPNVASVTANGRVGDLALEHVGQPAVVAAGWRGSGAVAVVDTGEGCSC
jgi:hypothetical protein